MKKKIILVFLLGIYILATYIFSPTLCIFNNFTGLPCPGCGLTRAYLSFLRGDILKAFAYHPLFPLPAIVVLILIYNKIKVNKYVISKNLVVIFIIVTISVYVIRMALLFPTYEPMNINYDGLIPRFLKFLGVTRIK